MKETSSSTDEKAARPVSQPIDALQHLTKTPAGRAHMLQRIDGFITYTEGTRENIERTRSLIRDGYVPVLYANHQSHADKLVLSGIVQSLVQQDTNGQVSKFLVPISATIESGGQGAYIQHLMSVFEPLYLDRGYGADVPFITDNDRQARGIEGSNVHSVRRLMGAPRDKHGLVIFPEATLKGGRRRADGTLNGIQEVTPVTGSGLIGYPKSWLKRGLGEAAFMPIGISGSYRVYPPDSGQNKISPEVITGILGSGRIEALVAISAGKPYTYADLRDEVEEDPDPKQKKHLDLMMGKIAGLLPAAERGCY
jgi:1-acyl-sn-glycerol-3-phosphate acyltransferase